MKNTIIILLTLSFLLVCCKPNKSNESELSIESSFVVDNRILEMIDLMKTESKTYSRAYRTDSIFFILNLYSQNDSNFLLLSEDIQPPIIFNYKTYKGYFEHKNDYIFIFSKLNDTISNEFFIENNLKNTLDDLRKFSVDISSPTFDGRQYIYHIDKAYNLELIK